MFYSTPIKVHFFSDYAIFTDQKHALGRNTENAKKNYSQGKKFARYYINNFKISKIAKCLQQKNKKKFKKWSSIASNKFTWQVYKRPQLTHTLFHS